MTQPDSPQGRPRTRRELRELREHSAPADTGRARTEEGAPEPPAAADRPRPEPTVPLASGQADAGAAAPQGGQASQGGQVPQGGQAPRGPVDDADAETAADAELHDLLSGHHDGSAPKKKRRRGGCLIALVILLAVLGGLAGVGVWAVSTYGQEVADRFGISVFGIDPTPTDYEPGLATGETTITISEGDTGWEVSVALYEAGTTLTESVFYDMLVSSQRDPELMPGTYQLQQKMTAEAALEAIEDLDNKLDDAVFFPEGFTLEQIVPRIAAGLEVEEDRVRDALSDPGDYGVDGDSLEGWLFPATYQFDRETTPREAIQRMVDGTREALEAAGVPDAQAERILTIASIIQREARDEDDFYKVSRVIVNRLDESISATGGLLQMDSTAQYGYGEMHEGDVFSSEEALNDDNPWNTYVRAGLPAGPISNPGALAIDAAMHPAEGPWQFFVTVNLDTGETVFSETYEQQLAAEAELHAWCEANSGTAGC